MKKLFTLFAIFTFVSLGYSQTYLNEDFSSNQVPPADWTIEGLETQWAPSGTNNAGGSAPEAKFTYVNQVSNTKLISPNLDLTGVSNVTLKFDIYYDDYSGTGPIIGIATRTAGGAWTDAWTENPGSDIGPETMFIEIETADVGNADFQFCIYLDGNMYNIDYLYLDNIVLYTPLNLDAEMTSISTAPYLGGTAEVTGMVTNYGLTEVTSIGINWQVDDGDITETTIDGISIPTNGTYNYICNGLIDLPIGGYTLKVWIETVNGGEDDFEDNNMLTKGISVLSHTVDKTPLFEEFTSSTCGPCATFNQNFVPWSETNADNIVLVKYQMNWPGSGDPYYIEEAGVRRSLYGVSYVPDLYGDGSQVATNMGAVEAFYESSSNEAAFVEAVATHSLDGTTINVTANVLPFANIENAMVHIVVFEYKTTGNVASNGETEFHHVMMKMLPDASGTASDLSDREPISITESFDMSSTFVEEIEDLGVAIIVQAQDAFVFQSVYSIEDEVYATEARLVDVKMDGTSLDGFDQDVFEYSINLPSNTTEVPALDGIPVDENSIVVAVPTTELPGTSIIDVFGQDLVTHNRYEFEFTLGVGIDENIVRNANLYPNPAQNQIRVNNLPDNASIMIIDVTGRTMLNMDASQIQDAELSVNTSDFENGIYQLQIIVNGQTMVKKFSVMK